MSSPDPREVVLAAYDPAWPGLFVTERQRIVQAAGAAIVQVHHAGSTAVPGLLAKPIIDIVIELRKPLIDSEVADIEALGFEYRGEQGIAGRQYFSRRETPEVHLHCFVAGHAEVRRMLAFRDYLRANPETATAYEKLKRRLATSHRFDRVAYTEAKTEFVRGVDALAAAYGADV